MLCLDVDFQSLFLLQTGNVPISLQMKGLLTGDAVNFNRRRSRYGYIFQNCSKSIVCHENAYLLELVRYIHLNPLLVELVSEYGILAGHPYVVDTAP